MTERPEPVQKGSEWVVRFHTELGSTMTFTATTREAALTIIDTICSPSAPMTKIIEGAKEARPERLYQIDHDELRTLASKATNVSWRPGHLCRDDHSCDCRYIFADNDTMGAIASVHVDDGKNDCPPLEEAKANQAFIAAANPPCVIDLLDEITTLRQQLAEARERNLIANERADNAQADAAKARARALEEAAALADELDPNAVDIAAAIRALAAGREG